jgi:hypothetical protein
MAVEFRDSSRDRDSRRNIVTVARGRPPKPARKTAAASRVIARVQIVGGDGANVRQAPRTPLECRAAAGDSALVRFGRRRDSRTAAPGAARAESEHERPAGVFRLSLCDSIGERGGARTHAPPEKVSSIVYPATSRIVAVRISYIDISTLFPLVLSRRVWDWIVSRGVA